MADDFDSTIMMIRESTARAQRMVGMTNKDLSTALRSHLLSISRPYSEPYDIIEETIYRLDHLA